jgi:hypothetical protein
MKPPGQDLSKRGGGYAVFWSYGEVLALAGSYPSTVTQAPLRSDLDTVVPSLRPLASS